MGRTTDEFLLERGYTERAPDGYICAIEADAVFGMPKTVFYSIVQRKDCPCVRIGSTPLIDSEYVAWYMREEYNKRRLASSNRVYSHKDIELDEEDTLYMRRMTDEEIIAQYYAERWQRVRDRAQRILEDGRIATDLGLVFG